MSTSDLAAVPEGERVTVRHRLPDGRATDAVGTLVSRDATTVTLLTRRGEVTIPLGSVLVHRRVRPVPWRVATFLRRAGVAVLEVESLTDSTAPALAGPARELVDQLVEAGVPVVVLDDGEGRGPLTVDRGADWPAERALAAAHARIEARLGRQLGRGRVSYTDPRPAHVEAARAFGWQARVLTPPS